MKYSLSDDFLNSGKVLYPFLKYGYDYISNRIKAVNPWAVEIHPTAKCNHQCIHCSYKERNESRAELDPAVFNGLIEDLITMRVKGVYFSGGGEPCVYPLISEAISKLNENGVEVSIVTNGSFLIKKGIIDVADRLNYIAVSVPSCNADTFERITGKRYVEDILSLPEQIHERYGEASPIVGARVVVTNLIVDEVPDILSILKRREYDYALFKIVRDYEDRGLGVNQEKDEQLQKDILMLKE